MKKNLYSIFHGKRKLFLDMIINISNWTLIISYVGNHIKIITFARQIYSVILSLITVRVVCQNNKDTYAGLEPMIVIANEYRWSQTIPQMET